MGHSPNTTTSHPTHIPNAGGHIRQPPQLLHGAGHRLLHRMPRGLFLWRTPRRLQQQTSGIVHREPGIRPKKHEEGDSPRSRLIHRYDHTLLGGLGATRLGGYPLVLRSDTD